jgi:diguanylate cyclase (GGDEF)-like protein
MGTGDDRLFDGRNGNGNSRNGNSRNGNPPEQRLRSILACDAGVRSAATTVADRAARAVRRDEQARARDVIAQARDALAEHHDTLIERHGGAAIALEDQLAAMRLRAAADRARAAEDRDSAAADRAAAARDRAQLQDALRQAQHDPLTGAFGRELGMIAIEREINRARHADGRLVLVFVDVDGLKHVNDHDGHAAGDALLRTVVRAIETQLRSYDPIVRIGGDEFVCALSQTDLQDARSRFTQIRALIEEAHPSASISAGFAVLGPEDTLEDLTSRGDDDLYKTRNRRSAR